MIELWFCVTLDTKCHFGDVSPSQSLGLVCQKLNITQQKRAFANQTKCTTAQNEHKKTKARFSRLLRHPTSKGSGSIFKGKISKGGDKEIVEEKKMSGDAYDICKQTIQTKSKIESRAHYAPEPAWGGYA